ncbi:MAG: AraC family transcriptional regulator [Rhodothermales bacterium]|nr:AraC family transcriptional regulator [Rhodothermales bacterium]
MQQHAAYSPRVSISQSPFVILRFRSPPAPLDGYVSLLTYHRGYDPEHVIERLLPDGGINLIVDLTNREKHIFDNERLSVVQTCEQSWISGVRTELISISAGLNSCMLVISFPPWGASAFTDVPMDRLADRVLPAQDVWGSSMARLRERAGQASRTDERLAPGGEADGVFDAAEAWLGENFRHPGNGFSLARSAAERLMHDPAMVAIDEIVSAAGASHRHMISLFARYVGVTPKRLQRVRRFQRVVEEVHRTGDVDWAALALDCGFCDQAHLIREFKAFSGLSPGRYLEVRGEIMNYVPVNVTAEA